MLSRLALATLLLSRTPLMRAGAPGDTTLSCPASIRISETAAPQPPFAAVPAQATHTLLTASVLNIDRKDEYDLKPDDTRTRGAKTILVWNLDDYRDHELVLRCGYRDSGVKLSVELPKPLHHCEAALTLTPSGTIVGTSTVKCK